MIKYSEYAETLSSQVGLYGEGLGGGKTLRMGRAQAGMQILKAGVLYFTLVFGAGFVLGTFRILWVVPRFGIRMAELMETPIMFVVTIVAARG